MSLEQSIAALTGQAGQLLDLPQTIADEALLQITAVSQKYQDHLSDFSVIAYVDAVTGDDAAVGDLANPFKTINKAVAITPPGGTCDVRLANDYHFTAIVPLVNKRLHLTSATTVKYRVTFGTSNVLSGGLNYRNMYGLVIYGQSRVVFSNLTLVMPTTIPAEAGFFKHNQTCMAYREPTQTSAEFITVGFVSCAIDIPVSPYGFLVSMNRNPSSLFAYNITVVNQPILGNWILGAQNTAGTASSGLGWLLTNLTTV